jgi:Caspase domain
MYKLLTISISLLLSFFAQAQKQQKRFTAEINTGSKGKNPDVSTHRLIWYQPRATEVPRGISTDKPDIHIELQAESSQSFEGTTFETYLNGRPYSVSKVGEGDLILQETASEGLNYQTFNRKITLPTAGRYGIEVRLLRQGKEVARSKALTVQYELAAVEAVNLHVLAVGPQFNSLLYTEKDAKDFAQLFENQSRLYKTKTTYSLVGKEANLPAILAQLEVIKNKYKRKELTDKDMLVLFFSTHGDNPNGTFYIQPAGYLRSNPKLTGLSWEMIADALKEVNCKKFLFIDACKSGTINPMASLGGKVDADPTAIARAQKEQFKSRPGWAIFTSSDEELSWEDPSWENGSFTKAIREGLAEGKADASGEGIITIKELYDYLYVRVPVLNESIRKLTQIPQLKNELSADLPIYIVQKTRR